MPKLTVNNSTEEKPKAAAAPKKAAAAAADIDTAISTREKVIYLPAAVEGLSIDDQLHAAVYWCKTHTRAQLYDDTADEFKRLDRYVKFIKKHKPDFVLPGPAPSSIPKKKIKSNWW